MHKMRPIATDGVAWSVGLSVGHVLQPCKNNWTDRDAVWGLTYMGQKNCVLDGIKVGQIRSLPRGV